MPEPTAFLHLADGGASAQRTAVTKPEDAQASGYETQPKRLKKPFPPWIPIRPKPPY
jgi:hypothetical protein